MYLFIDTIKYPLPNMNGIAIYQEEVAALKLQGEEKKRSDVTT